VTDVKDPRVDAYIDLLPERQEAICHEVRGRATDASGAVKIESCRVHLAGAMDQQALSPSEVMDVWWDDNEDLGRPIVPTQWAFGP
jgi:isopentenyldiphosphate isomerase